MSMGDSMPNIKDVAKRAGVGIATVSRVVNGTGPVKKETREKIEQVIKELGYKPNEIARSMINQKTKMIAFVVPHSNHVFFSELIYHVDHALSRYGMKLMVCNSGSHRERELELITMLTNNRVDGLIFLTSNDIENYLPKGYPIVSFDRRFDGIPFVASDNYEGGRLAAKTLLESGAEKLLFIGDDAQGELSQISTEVSKRRKGFIDYLKEVQHSNYKIIEYPQGDLFLPKNYIHDTIVKHLDYDGIFAISDQLAHEIILVLNEHHIAIPTTTKIVGYDGIEGAINTGITITSIAQPIAELSEALVETLMKMIAGKPVESTILPIALKPGDSTL